MKKKTPNKSEAKTKVMNLFTSFVKKQGRAPTRAEMLNLGVSRDSIRSHYGSISNLKEVARQHNPETFRNIIDDSYFTEEKFQSLLKDVKKHKRFIVTTAVVGCKVHPKFLAAIENYAKRNKALPLVLPSADPSKSSEWALDSVLAKKNIHIIFKDVALNSNIFISSIKTSAKQIAPMTGLERIGSRNGSFIFASPKQDLQFVAVSNVKYPHAMMTTGAITLPDYETNRYMSERTSYIANEDHIMGALIIERQDDNRFHFRQIQAEPKSGGFVDLGIFYNADGTTEKMEAEALVMGDFHSGETDPTAKQAWKEITEQIGVKNLVLHDMFNGRSISHHDKKRKVKMAQKYYEGNMSLKQEALTLGKDLKDLSSWIDGKMIWVKSNHDTFLARLLEDGTFVEDPINFVLCSSLVKPMFEGQDPLKVLVENESNVSKDIQDRIVWLSLDQDYKIAGHQCGAHGDLGAHGKRNPGLNEMQKSYGSSISGHSHTPGILRTSFRVGTSSYLKLDYNSGSSAWLHTSCLVYPNGSRQLINSIEGRWRL